jgi:thioredoxin-related protein
MNRRVRSWIPLLALFLGVGVLGAMRESRAGGDITWANSFAEGSRLAQQTHKPMLLSFHTVGCGWCNKLDAETFCDPKVVELSRQYICVRLDSALDGEVAGRYQVMEYPTLILADPQGKPMMRIPQYIAPEQFAPALSDILNTVSRRP